MQTFDQQLLSLYENDIITEETARSYCTRKSYVLQGVDKIKASKGIETSDIEGLSMEREIKGVRPETIMPSTPTRETRGIKPETIMPSPQKTRSTSTFQPGTFLNVNKTGQLNVSQKTNIQPGISQPQIKPGITPIVTSQNPTATLQNPAKNENLPKKGTNFDTQEIINLKLDN